MKARSMRTRVAMALPLVVIAALAQRRFPQRPDA
jgi:hypothetical protein